MGGIKVSVIVEAFPDVPGVSTSARDTLASLERQDYPLNRVEIIVPQHGWSAELRRTVEQQYPRARILDAPEAGYNRLKNLGVQHARGEIIAFADSDTTVCPRWVSSLVETIDAGADVSIGLMKFSGDSLLDRLCTYFMFGQMLRRSAGRMRSFNIANVAFKASLIKANPLDERLTRQGGSIEIGRRLFRAGAALALSPDQVSEHEFYGINRHTWQFAIFETHDFLEVREKHPAMSLSGLTRRLPLALPPVAAAALFGADLVNLIQNRRFIRMRLFESPVFVLASLAMRTFEIPAMYWALIDRKGVRAFLERRVI